MYMFVFLSCLIISLESLLETPSATSLCRRTVYNCATFFLKMSKWCPLNAFLVDCLILNVYNIFFVAATSSKICSLDMFANSDAFVYFKPVNSSAASSFLSSSAARTVKAAARFGCWDCRLSGVVVLNRAWFMCFHREEEEEERPVSTRAYCEEPKLIFSLSREETRCLRKNADKI